MKKIIEALNQQKAIDQWRILGQKSTSYQLYVIGSMVDCVRKVITNKYHVTIFCRHDSVMGHTHLTVLEHEFESLDRRLESAIFTAKRVSNPCFELPGPDYTPAVETFDPSLTADIEDVLFIRLADRIIDGVEREPYVRLSASEYFLELNDLHLVNSRGVDVDWKQSEISFDGILLSGDMGEEVEVHFEPRARRLQELDLESIIRTQSQFARDARHAVLPPSGKYPVALSGEALTQIFAPIIHHTSGDCQYRRSSRFKPGQPIYAKDDPLGDSLTMISNGFLPFGLRTAPVDHDGIPAGRHEIIRDGLFMKPWCSKQSADYLGLEPTGEIANLEIPIGNHPRSTLLSDRGPVLQVQEFSALMPDVISGNFAAEIRFGYLHDKGCVTPVRGGSISGNLLDGFNDAYFSTEARQGQYGLSLSSFGTYSGPETIRFESFQVSGN